LAGGGASPRAWLCASSDDTRISHVQQSLHLPQRSHKWFAQASCVQ
jgi:hypothetical protein